MGIKAFVTGAMLASVAGGAMAQSLDPVRVEMFRSILQGNDCTLTEIAASNILPRFDFTKEETRAIVGALVAAGEVRLDGNTLMLVDGSCGTGDPVADLLAQADVQQFIAIMAENGCAMAEADAEPIFTARGMTKRQVGRIVRPMMDNGMASFANGVLTVDSAYCAPPVMADAQPEAPTVSEAPTDSAVGPELDRSGIFGMSRVRQLVDVMAQNGCMLNMEVADGYLAEAGIEHGFATFLARKMIADGYATMVDDQNMMLSAPYCIAAGGAPVVAEPDAPGATPVETPVEAPVETQMETPDETRTDEPTPMMAENESTPEAMFLSVAAQNGCALDATEAEAALGAVGLRMDQAYRIVDDLVAAGDASLSDGGALVSINPALCGAEMQPVEPEGPVVQEAPASPAPADTATTQPPAMADDDPRAGVLAMLADNGCEITQANAAEVIAAAGLDYTASIQILSQMMASGEATSPDGGQTLQVGPPLCEGAPDATPMTPREAFIDLIRQNDCRITAAEFGTLLPYKGLDAGTAFGLISELEAEGVISLPATRDVVTLSAEMCR